MSDADEVLVRDLNTGQTIRCHEADLGDTLKGMFEGHPEVLAACDVLHRQWAARNYVGSLEAFLGVALTRA